jgi:signal peptidase I
MTEFDNQENDLIENSESQLPVYSEEDLKSNEEWMKKSKRKITSFLIFTALILIFSLIFYANDLFIFSINSVTSDTSSTTIILNFVSYLFIIATFIYLFFYVTYYNKRRKLSISEQMETYSAFRKHYNAFDLLGVVPVFLACLTLINGFFFGFATVVGPSMEPTFCPGDYVVIEHFQHNYFRDDIMIFNYSDMKLIKRLVGVPGDVLSVNHSGVFINDVLIESRRLDHFISYDNYVIPEGSYFVLGDNRVNSNDSRYFGLIVQEDVLGEVIFKISNSTCNIE